MNRKLIIQESKRPPAAMGNTNVIAIWGMPGCGGGGGPAGYPGKGGDQGIKPTRNCFPAGTMKAGSPGAPGKDGRAGDRGICS